MNENHKELLSMWLTISIVGLTFFIVQRFIPSIIWAAIIGIATYPLYHRWHRLLINYPNISALLFTAILGLLVLLPLSFLLSILIKESQLFINYLQLINRTGGQAPAFLEKLPFLSNDLINYWNVNIGHPGNVKYLLSNFHAAVSPVSYYVKQISLDLAHRGFQLGFTFLILFFFYRDGEQLFKQINHIGEFCLSDRWFRYANRLPSTLRATVNGTIVVGLGVGILMGICYFLVGFPGPTLTGFITAFAAMIPFAVPVVLAIIGLVLLGNGAMIAAIVVLVWGTIVMFVADHFIKPVLIGGAIELPFLGVLFGVLGGVETLGLLGLFVGPIIMVFFITLWQEPRSINKQKNRGVYE